MATYVTHPGIKMIDKVIAGLKDKTGKTLEEWIRAVKRSGKKTAKDRAAWLKSEHWLGTNYAMWIVEAAEGKDARAYEPDDLVEKMFAAKPNLRPIYDRLLALGTKLGKDVTVTPCSTIVPLRRRFVFAQIKPTTKTRIDLGLALGAIKAQADQAARLVDTGGYAKKDRITHRIELTSVADIDDEVKRWMKKAYELDA